MPDKRQKKSPKQILSLAKIVSQVAKDKKGTGSGVGSSVGSEMASGAGLGSSIGKEVSKKPNLTQQRKPIEQSKKPTPLQNAAIRRQNSGHRPLKKKS